VVVVLEPLGQPRDRQPGARQSAHHRAHRQPEGLRGLAVRQSFDAHQKQHLALRLGQLRHGASYGVERDSSFNDARAVHDDLFLRIDHTAPLPHLSTAELVDPHGSHDAEHPTVEPGPRHPLMLALQGALACGLDEIVGVLGRARQAASEATEPGQEP